MTKTKIFVANHNKQLESDLNKWLEENFVYITDVNYSMAFNLENNEMYYSAFLMYEHHVSE